MKTLILTIALLAPMISHADFIDCTFTEPFIDSLYDMGTSKLTYTDTDGSKTVIKNVSFVIKAAGIFELVKDGKVLQSLELNNSGSNGMSDHMYPYSVKDYHTLTHQGFGGCESRILKAVLPGDHVER